MALGTKRKAANTLSKQPLDLPPATVHAFAGTSAPEGWAMCDGSEVSRTEYAALFAAIGTTYGVGDGSTTFNLPDMRGEFLRGLDDMGTAAGARGKDVDGTARTVGQTQADQFQGHGHDLYVGNTSSTFAHLASQNQIALADNTGGRSLKSSQSGAQDIINTPLTLGANGAPRFGDETRPANIAINYIIKL